MKKVKYSAANVMTALFFIVFTTVTLHVLFAVPMLLSAIVLSLLSFLPVVQMPKNSFYETFYRQAWESEAIKRFDNANNNSWRQGLKNLGKYATMLADGETLVINLAYFGVKPDVLVDNTAYPIAIQQLDAENIAISVRKYQTKATPITDDELFGLAYDKIRTVQESHILSIEEEKNARALHSVCPVANTAATPILLTTGDVVAGRRMLRIQDLLDFRDKLNRLKQPKLGRRMVLCNDHINDLLKQDEKFANQWYNKETGALNKMFNFEFFEFEDAPYINTTTRAKTSYGAVPQAGRDFESSVYLHSARVVTVTGQTKVYASKSSDDPQNQRSLINYRHYDLVVPYKQEAIGAIASAPGA